LQAAVTLAPATLLRLLAGVASAGKLPAVSVHLSGGQILDGLLVRVGTDHGNEVVVLAGEHTGQLGYVLLANVVAVEVAAPELFQDVLTGGRLPQPSTGEPITRLQLRRDFAPSAEFPLQVDWAALTDSGPLLANLGRLLAGLRETVRQVCADETGRRAWAQIRTLRVEHHEGAQPSVRLAPDGLSVQADLTAALPRDLVGELGRQFNDLL
jgi:hypothetical protein